MAPELHRGGRTRREPQLSGRLFATPFRDFDLLMGVRRTTRRRCREGARRMRRHGLLVATASTVLITGLLVPQLNWIGARVCAGIRRTLLIPICVRTPGKRSRAKQGAAGVSARLITGAPGCFSTEREELFIPKNARSLSCDIATHGRSPQIRPTIRPWKISLILVTSESQPAPTRHLTTLPATGKTRGSTSAGRDKERTRRNAGGRWVCHSPPPV